LRTQGALAVWDGEEVLLVGGGSGFGSGYAFDPAANRWRELAQGKLVGVALFALWPGQRVIELGPNTSAYDPNADRWTILARAPQPLRVRRGGVDGSEGVRNQPDRRRRGSHSAARDSGRFAAQIDAWHATASPAVLRWRLGLTVEGGPSEAGGPPI
jgi:hypothetical protein